MFQQKQTATVAVVDTAPAIWPAAIEYPVGGQSLSNCAVNQPKAYNGAGAGLGAILVNKSDPNSIFSTDSHGCLQTFAGVAINETTNTSVEAYESGYTGTYAIPAASNTCGADISFVKWNPASASSPSGIVRFGYDGTKLVATCTLAVTDSSGNVTPGNTLTVAVANACTTGTCYLEYTQDWTTYVQCVGGAPGENCDVTHSAQDIYVSTDGGQSWTFFFQELYKQFGVCKTAARIRQ